VPGQGFKTQRCSEFKEDRSKAMYTGTLIRELMAIVERTEARIRDANKENELERWYATQHQIVRVDSELVGVA
jgi:hypothetical protein